MACTNPITAYKSRNVNPSGKRSLIFNKVSPLAFADLPVTIPCGMCIGCRIQRARTWALRCVHESKGHTFNSFVTLTYDDANIPDSQAIEKSTLQLFFKRLRKAGYVFRYFAAGEYGSTTNRPHYHVLFFGIDFHDDRKLYKRSETGNLYTSEKLSQIWGLGHAIIAGFNYTTAQYVAKYIIGKKLGKDSADSAVYSRLDLSTGECFQVSPEFVLMSRRPGIGAEWYAQFADDAFPSDFLVHDGKKFTVPKYYLNKLEKSDENMHKSVKKKRRIEQYKNPTDHRTLQARALILSQREKQKSRAKI
ncbi:MAG: replication initiator protein [Microviridae sp.]|nr:MAG: replication initiator protein [Microviridae sp.]